MFQSVQFQDSLTNIPMLTISTHKYAFPRQKGNNLQLITLWLWETNQHMMQNGEKPAAMSHGGTGA